jgi:hypothetical protein
VTLVNTAQSSLGLDGFRVNVLRSGYDIGKEGEALMFTWQLLG